MIDPASGKVTNEGAALAILAETLRALDEHTWGIIESCFRTHDQHTDAGCSQIRPTYSSIMGNA